MVRLTRIYTRTGDRGWTRLADNSRVLKTDPRVGAYADVDEANAAIGVAVALGGLRDQRPDLAAVLTQVQNDLFDVGADLATPVRTAEPGTPGPGTPGPGTPGPGTPGQAASEPASRKQRERPPAPALRITQEAVDRLEGWCDQHNAELPALRSFVLPGGTPAAALLHQARTVVRRAERSVWAAWQRHAQAMNPLTATYLNRLSDLLFILARVANAGEEVLWRPGGSAPEAPAPDSPAEPGEESRAGPDSTGAAPAR